MSDDKIEPHYVEQMNVLARAIDELFNGELKGKDRTTGFVLLVFPFGEEEGQRTNYISNGNRRDILIALKEVVARFEGQPEMKGHA